MTLTRTLQEELEYQHEQAARRLGVPDSDIKFSRLSGIDARDVKVFRELTHQGFLIVVRCPKVAARAWHGHFPPKNIGVKAKTGASGVVVTDKGKLYVSDYDLMSAWKIVGSSFTKIFMSAPAGAARGRWGPEARDFVLRLNQRLVSRIQHGCQDDYHSPNNPGVKAEDHFAAFERGQSHHLVNPDECARYYRLRRLTWPYNPAGRYLSG